MSDDNPIPDDNGAANHDDNPRTRRRTNGGRKAKRNREEADKTPQPSLHERAALVLSQAGRRTHGPDGPRTYLNDLDEETITRAGHFLIEGHHKHTVAAVLGIPKITWWSWEQRGEREPDSVFGRFLYIVDTAQAMAEILLLQDVRRGGSNWQAAAWVMERRFPKAWGRRVEVLVQTEAERLAARFGKTVDEVIRDAEAMMAGAPTDAAPPR